MLCIVQYKAWNNMKPTTETYSELQQAYDAFNDALFDGKLPECLITLQREKSSYGYFCPNRFTNLAGDQVDEIALNPTYFAVIPLIEIMQTLVHEMTHAWQFHFGQPGRARYHNSEWADKMESIGLMPSSTGQPGGKRTGDSMADYAIEGGRFIAACRELITGDFKISWYDRFSSKKAIAAGEASFANTLDMPEGFPSVAINEGVELVDPSGLSGGNKSNRCKYTCQCGFNIWGKPNLSVLCNECGTDFISQ
jgi:SprT-like family